MLSDQGRRCRGGAAAVLGVLAIGAGASATTIIVNPGGSIQGAIAAAAPGDVIVVNPGMYTGNFDLLGKAVTLRSAQGANVTHLVAPASGGSVVRCVSGETAATVIDGFTIRNGQAADGGGVLIVGASPRIESCTISGNAAGRGGGVAVFGGAPALSRCMLRLNRADRGGGMHAEDSAPVISMCELASNGGNEDFGSGAGLSLLRSDGSVTDCSFSGNKQVTGGGLLCEDSSPVVTRCTFSANSSEAGNGGGAMLMGGAPTVQSCTFENNVTNYGTGAAMAVQASAALVTGCEFANNRAISPGGASGVYIGGAGAPAVVRCRVFGGDGSAVVVGAGAGTPLMAACLITRNEAYSGAGVRLIGGAPVIASCTIAGNTSPTGMGGGVAIEGGTGRIVGCTLVGNRAPEGGAVHHSGGNPALTGTIVWACASLMGGPPIGSVGGMAVTYSCVQGGWAGQGNIDVPPGLGADPESAYRLLPLSPCIDAGSNTAFPADAADLDGDGDLSERLPLDHLGRARFIDDPGVSEPAGMTPPVADIGAVEFQAAAEGCPSDWDRNGQTNSTDISAFLTAWLAGQRGGPWVTDMNVDGRLDSGDISAFLARWVEDVGGC